MYKLLAFVILVTLATASLAQKPVKPWKEWTKKDVEKMLTDSPWAQTQTETDASQMFFTPTTATTATGSNSSPGGEGATNQATSIKFRIRFFSAKPIRQAIAHVIAEQNKLDATGMSQLNEWANLRTNEYIVISVSYEGNDRRYLGRVSQAFNSAVTAVLKNTTYLERRDGKRVFLSEYRSPKSDGYGAQFVFPRNLDERPFLTPDSGSVRFHTEQENQVALDSQANPIGQTSRNATRPGSGSIQPESPFKIKLDMKFKIAEMLYDGVLEY